MTDDDKESLSYMMRFVNRVDSPSKQLRYHIHY